MPGLPTTLTVVWLAAGTAGTLLALGRWDAAIE